MCLICDQRELVIELGADEVIKSLAPLKKKAAKAKEHNRKDQDEVVTLMQALCLIGKGWDCVHEVQTGQLPTWMLSPMSNEQFKHFLNECEDALRQLRFMGCIK